MRNINEIIIHCAFTPTTMDLDMATVRLWHLSRGFSDIGYHYFIKLNGDIEKGRDLSKIGAHCRRHNRNSIGICYAGGMNSDGSWGDTRTGAQKEALIKLINSLKIIFPNIKRISGHCDYSKKACPCFDAKKEYN